MDDSAGPGEPAVNSSRRRGVFEEAGRILAGATADLSVTPNPPTVERVSIALGVLQDAILAMDQEYEHCAEQEAGGVSPAALAARAACAAAAMAGATTPPDTDDATNSPSSRSSSSHLSAAVALYEARFRELVVLPTLKRLAGASAAAKKKPPAEKAVVAARAVGALIAKAANPNKQPAFAQFLTSALRPSKKGQLDCVGAATAVLAAVLAVAREEEEEEEEEGEGEGRQQRQQQKTHAALAGARLAFSDDHSWLVFNRRAEEEQEEAGKGGGGGGGDNSSAGSSSSSLLGPAWGGAEEEEVEQGGDGAEQPQPPRRHRLSLLLRRGRDPDAAARGLAPPPDDERRRRKRRRHFLHRRHDHDHGGAPSPPAAVEATDARVLKPGEARGWLYALPPQLAAEAEGPALERAAGLVASPRQLPGILAAALVPEDVCPLRPPKQRSGAPPAPPPRGSEDAADAMRAAQLLLLARLAPLPFEGALLPDRIPRAATPPMPFYSTLFRWGLAAEELELERLERAADTRDPKKARAALRRQQQQPPPPPPPQPHLPQQPPPCPSSQELFRLSLRLSDGRQWQPASCALFGRMQRLQSALCGSEGAELVLGRRVLRPASASQKQQQPLVDPSVLPLAEALLVDALAAARPAVDVIRAYAGAAADAGGGGKAAVRDAPLIRGPRDALEHFADAFHGMAHLLEMVTVVRSAGVDVAAGAAAVEQEEVAVAGAGAAAAAAAAAEEEEEEEVAAAAAPAVAAAPLLPEPRIAAVASFSAPASSARDRMRADLEAAMAAARPTQAGAPLPPTPEEPPAPTPATTEKAAAAHVASSSSSPSQPQLGPERAAWLVPALLLVDAALEYWGPDSVDADAPTVEHFLHATAAFTPDAVRAAVEGARPQLQSERLRAAAAAGGALEAVAAAYGGGGGGGRGNGAVAAAKAALLMPRKRARRG